MNEKSLGWTEDIICLANSRKPHGTCVAGKRIRDGSWVRPISARPGHEVNNLDRQYSDGNEVDVLDKLQFQCVEKRPSLHQSENILFDDRYRWSRIGRATWDELEALVDLGANLWENGHSGYQHQNNRVPAEHLSSDAGSLRLIKVSELILHVEQKAPGFDASLKVRASFSYKGDRYRLDVTDPKYEHIYIGRGQGTYRFESLLVCVSLSEIYSRDNCAYKLVATLIPQQRARK